MATKSFMRQNKGFTLIEMLVVLAITAILMGIIVIPMIQSFNFTRLAIGFAEAQERARRLMEQMTREISNSAGVRDNDGYKGMVAVVVPGLDGNPESVLLEYAKLDVMLPAQGDPANVRDGAFVGPGGHADPTLRAPKGQVTLPVAPGMTLVRYWIGLRQPLAANGLDPAFYRNPYDGLLMPRTGGQDNLYVLYRAEVQPMVYQNGQFVMNSEFFADVDGDGRPDLDDPYFFVQDPPGQPPLTPQERQDKARRIQSWRRRAVVVTEFARYDMIMPVYNRQTQEVAYDGNVPRIYGLVQFRPNAISNEPATGQTALRMGEETDNPGQIAPDVFRTNQGNWSGAIVRLFPATYSPNDPNNNEYLIARFDARAGNRGFRIYAYDPDNDLDNDDRTGDQQDIQLFDVGVYERWIAEGRVYPFTRAALAAHNVSGWMNLPQARASFAPFFTDLTAGKVFTSFGIDQIGMDDPTGTTPPRPDGNWPFVSTGFPYTPANDPLPPGNFWDPQYAEINRKFNRVWADNPNLQGPNLHRFIDLRVTPNADGAIGPLHPDPATGFPHARLVPGSEIVIGPDQNPGPNYGSPVRYTRTTRTPMANQYRINYVDLPEPNYALLGLNQPPPNYDPQNFESAIIQPRFKAGYIQLNSDPNVALPEGEIRVFYRFQFTQPQDTLTVDYDSRQLINILLTIRHYPQATNVPNPQLVTLTGTAAVRNYLR